MRLLDGDVLPRFRFPVLRKCGVVVLEQLARRIVGNVQQGHTLAKAQQGSPDGERHEKKSSYHFSPRGPLPCTIMGRTLASVFFLLFRLFAFCRGPGFTMSARDVLSRIFAAASRTSRNTWYNARCCASRSIRLRSCSASPKGARGPSISRMMSLSRISEGARRNW